MQGLFSGSRTQAEQTQYEIAQTVKRNDGGPQEYPEPPKRPYDPQRSALAALKRETFRRELAQDDVQYRDDAKRDRNGDDVGSGEAV